jgi:hypothetical protein
MTKERKAVYDVVIGAKLLTKYNLEIDSFNGVNYDVIQIDRPFDNIENECNKLF